MKSASVIAASAALRLASISRLRLRLFMGFPFCRVPSRKGRMNKHFVCSTDPVRVRSPRGGLLFRRYLEGTSSAFRPSIESMDSRTSWLRVIPRFAAAWSRRAICACRILTTTELLLVRITTLYLGGVTCSCISDRILVAQNRYSSSSASECLI